MSAIVVDGLSVTFTGSGRPVQAVRDLSFAVDPGRTLGIVGESGSGKSATALALLGMHDPRSSEVAGSVLLGDRQVIGADEKSLRPLRGTAAAMVFQNPQSALHPFHTIGDQIAEAYLAHHEASRTAAQEKAREMLDRVGIAAASRRLDDYPHQFSGGMRQRAMIALALVNHPRLLIADEPTTALDVTVQAQILGLLAELQREHDMAVILISHDLGVVGEMADDVLVMYAGRAVEHGPAGDLLSRPGMPYTRGLLHCIPNVHAPAERLPAIPGSPPDLTDPPAGCAFHPRCPVADAVPGDRCRTVLPELTDRAGRLTRCHLPTLQGVPLPPSRPRIPAQPQPQPRPWAAGPLLDVTDLSKHFPVGRTGVLHRATRQLRAVDGVSLRIHEGQSLGLVGESGCGKTTTGQLLVRLLEPTSGSIRFDGTDVGRLSQKAMRPVRRHLQMVFQDPYSSLNSRQSAGTIIGTPLTVHRLVPRRQVLPRVQELMSMVGLDPDHHDRYPHEFSGGQRQRIGLARALAVRPKLIVADEPVSSLDTSVQAQVVNLLTDLQAELGVAFLFISHDLAVVRHFCHDVAVMYLGRIVESGPADVVYARPAHPYTRALLDAVPDVTAPRRERILLAGEARDQDATAAGCRFRSRCPIAQDVCAVVEPPLVPLGDGRAAACHFA